MSTTYPDSLRRPLIAGYELTADSPTTATERDRTAARARGLGRAACYRVHLAWHLPASQFQTFAAWFRTDLQHGAQAATIALINGWSDEPVPIQFLGPYTVHDLGGALRVEADAEFLTYPRMDAETYADLIDWGESLRDGLAFAPDLHRIVHVVFPRELT
jgi:hypothetical protein